MHTHTRTSTLHARFDHLLCAPAPRGHSQPDDVSEIYTPDKIDMSMVTCAKHLLDDGSAPYRGRFGTRSRERRCGEEVRMPRAGPWTCFILCIHSRVKRVPELVSC